MRAELFDHRAAIHFRSAILPYSREALRLSCANHPLGRVKNAYALQCSAMAHPLR